MLPIIRNKKRTFKVTPNQQKISIDECVQLHRSKNLETNGKDKINPLCSDINFLIINKRLAKEATCLPYTIGIWKGMDLEVE